MRRNYGTFSFTIITKTVIRADNLAIFYPAFAKRGPAVKTKIFGYDNLIITAIENQLHIE
ncbi:hypothetical protein D3C76_1499600 [compost metagenome]